MPRGVLSCGFGRLLNQTLDRWRALSAHASPVGQTVLRNAQAFFATFGDRVVETDTLDEATIATNALVCHNNVEKRTGFRAAAGESNDDHDESFGWVGVFNV